MELTRRSQKPTTVIIDNPGEKQTVTEVYRDMPRKVFATARRLPLKAKVILVVTLSLSAYFYSRFFRTLLTNHLAEEEFLEMSTCPACYGKSMCPMLLSGQYKFNGLSKIRYLDFLNVKNVHVSSNGPQKKMVMKKLGHNSELVELNRKICTKAGYDPSCDPTRAIYQTQEATEREMNPNVIRGLTPAMHCPSQRLVDRIVQYYTEKGSPGETLESFEDRLYLITTLMVNAEPIIMQAFPPTEGYPFPKYVGACGRFVAVEHAGPSLHKFYLAAWEERIDLAYQLLLIADTLTETRLGFAFYLTDVSFDNFAVNRDGKVIIVDLEDILVVDKAKIRREKRSGWDEPVYSSYVKCLDGESDCTSYSPDDLCTHDVVDHNYYMICRNLLSADNGDPLHPLGLLHGVPSDVEAQWQLQLLVRECTQPLLPSGRLKVKDQLRTALEEIRKDHF